MPRSSLQQDVRKHVRLYERTRRTRMKNLSDHDLGMDRPIARRDFLSGVAVGISGAVLTNLPTAQAQTPAAADTYPPLRSGLRGQYPDAVAEFARIRGGAYEKLTVPEPEAGEEYDLVVVGAG